jgi:hypothetical protein
MISNQRTTLTEGDHQRTAKCKQHEPLKIAFGEEQADLQDVERTNDVS